MIDRALLETRERAVLAPWGMKSADSRGRQHREDEADYRTVYQKDRDRIIHTTAFRRLAYKTQVFVYHEGDHYRNRLTHTMEVAQLGRTLARALGANEDLTEAICLAHDLGHPPFGHTGEHILDRLMADHGGFDHQRQTMRIVARLEHRYRDFPGLNLSYEVREGIVKHDTDYDVTNAEGYEPHLAGTLECQLANLADEIAWNTSDLDDGLYAGLLEVSDLAGQPLWQQVMDSLQQPYRPDKLDTLLRARIIRRLVGIEVNDAIAHTQAQLQAQAIGSVAELRAAGRNLAGFSPELAAANTVQKRYLFEHFYRSYRVVRMAAKAERILDSLFTAYIHEPRQLPPSTRQKVETSDDGLQRVVCDYLAGMTDRYAIQEHKRLFDPEERV
ncbi:MAG: deoxyguanosinetriphosphate triphosphohydrolase [Caldilineales bacterium]|nr:deoxyguanosinetriphosphate triphosphohydrolase [Caldilineales bacterium]MCW5859121.1 deoxyguanosinetriphosphate triphosphohydrolase [Caldilineales bacterium]